MESKFGKAHIVYFSGTGSTALSAQALAAALEKLGIQVKDEELFRDSTPVIENDEILILMFPVYAADAPAPIKKWIKQLSKAKDAKACVISVSGGGEISPNTACRKRTIRQLKNKGYEVSGEYMLCMPSNFIEPTDEEAALKLINILPHKCNVIAQKIAGGLTVRKRVKPIDHVLLPLFSMEKLGSKIFGRKLSADDSCNACGLCAKKCPRGNIKMHEGKPKFGWECVICMRCVYLCPQRSIKSGMPILKKMVLDDGYSIKEMQNRAGDVPYSVDEGEPEGYLWQGVKEYLENTDSV